MDALKCEQGETAADLDALLPAILDRAAKASSWKPCCGNTNATNSELSTTIVRDPR